MEVLNGSNGFLAIDHDRLRRSVAFFRVTNGRKEQEGNGKSGKVHARARWTYRQRELE
jgi:hypothetical protein